MKKLLIVLLAATSLSYADSNDCTDVAQKVVTKLASHNKTSVTLNYSQDKATQAQTCKAAILAKNPSLTVTLNQVDGTDKFKFSK
jgi:ABC-type sugar transport system substrate-binding protein